MITMHSGPPPPPQPTSAAFIMYLNWGRAGSQARHRPDMGRDSCVAGRLSRAPSMCARSWRPRGPQSDSYQRRIVVFVSRFSLMQRPSGLAAQPRGALCPSRRARHEPAQLGQIQRLAHELLGSPSIKPIRRPSRFVSSWRQAAPASALVPLCSGLLVPGWGARVHAGHLAQFARSSPVGQNLCVCARVRPPGRRAPRAHANLETVGRLRVSNLLHSNRCS